MSEQCLMREESGAGPNHPAPDASATHSASPEPHLRHYRSIIALITGAGFLITGMATIYLKSSADSAAEDKFTALSSDIGKAITARLTDHARILLSGAALFDASDSVTRLEWHSFIQRLKLDTQLPGIQGVGYAPVIPRAELQAHIRETRQEGFPSYTVTPEGDREIYAPVLYLEPFSGRNLRAFGYDTFLEPVRRTAMEQARDSDSAALTGKILLMQEADQDIQPGIVMFVPVYHKDRPILTVEQRRAAIRGWTASPCRMTDMIHGILNTARLQDDGVQFQLFDGEHLLPENLLYEFHPQETSTLRISPQLSRHLPIIFNTHRWTLVFKTAGADPFSLNYVIVWLTLGGGLLITLLLTALIRALLYTRADARRLAAELTIDLQKSEERHHAILQTAMDGFLLVDKKGRLLESNDTYCRMSGYAIQELLSLHISDLEADESEADTDSHIQGIIARGQARFESRHRRKNGTTYDVEISAQYRPIAEGQLEVFVRDTTERRYAEAELQKMQKLQSIGTLAGGIAHDFNNILMGLFGNISLAKQELSPDLRAHKSLAEAEKSMVRAIRLTKQLLTFAKGGEPVLENVCMGALVEEVAHFDLSGSNVMLVSESEPDLWMAKADKGQIEQVISNLATNARQAMPNGGHLYITLNNVVLGPGASPHLPPGKYIKVTVRDDGTGIDPKIIDRIFDPYYTTKQNGSGLGLATTYSIITKHGGHITVASQPGKGTTFTFYLPAGEARPQPREVDIAAEYPLLTPSPKVLVMDDDEFIRTIIRRWLSGMGCVVETAADGQQAIDLYRQALQDGKGFDLMILDLTIPGGLGGQEVIRSIHSFDPDAKAIVASGYADDSVMSNYAYFGFEGVICKPFTELQLRKILEQVLTRTKAGRPAD